MTSEPGDTGEDAANPEMQEAREGEHPHTPTWSFEHVNRGSLRSAARAAGAALRPWHLWRTLQPHHRLERPRLRRLVAIWMAAALLMIHLGLGAIWVPPWAPWHRTATLGEWLRALVWPYGFRPSEFVQYTIFPLLSSAAQGVLPMMLMALGVLIASRRAGVRNGVEGRAHIERGLAYGMATALIATVALHLLPFLLISPVDNLVLARFIESLWAMVLFGYPVWLGVFWHQFAKHYLQMPRAAAWMVLLVLVTIVLTIMTAVALHLVQDLLFPSMFAEWEALMEGFEQRR